LLYGIVWSGRRGSNSRPSAWKADALPTELLPLNTTFFIYTNWYSVPVSWCRGQDSNLRRALARRIYSPEPLTTRPPLQIFFFQGLEKPLGCSTYSFDAVILLYSRPLPLFRFLKLSVKEWQLGQRSSKFDSLLFSALPSLWFTSRGTLPVLEWCLSQPQALHLSPKTSIKYLLRWFDIKGAFFPLLPSTKPARHLLIYSLCW
jgi:hypothetical protein